MKEATGDMTMTIVVIVLIVAVLAVGRWLFGENGPLRKKIGEEITNMDTGESYINLVEDFYS